MTRPFRFGIQASSATSGAMLRETARRAEGAGYSVLAIADHLGVVDPFVACTTAAESTSTLRVGTNVLNIDFHPVTTLARACATLDLVSDGRFELGLGTGYALDEYRAARLSFDRPMARIRRVSDTIEILRRLFGGDTVTHDGAERGVTDHTLAPLPPQGADLPIMVGGNGDRLLAMAAQRADIVGFTGFGHDGTAPVLSHMTPAGLADRVAHVRAAGTDPELQALVQRVVVTDDRHGAAAAVAAETRIGDGDPAAVLECPFLLIGSVDSICDDLVERRERYGINYWVVFSHRADEQVDAVVTRLAGT